MREGRSFDLKQIQRLRRQGPQLSQNCEKAAFWEMRQSTGSVDRRRSRSGAPKPQGNGLLRSHKNDSISKKRPRNWLTRRWRRLGQHLITKYESERNPSGHPDI